MTAGNGAATDHDGGDVTDGAETSVGGSDDIVSRKEMAARNIEVAYRAIERGLSVFPVRLTFDDKGEKVEKKPLTRRGHLDAVTTRDEFDALCAGISLPSGAVLAAGCVPGSVDCVVFDGDIHGGKAGPSFLSDRLGLPTDTYRVNTVSGGVNYWLRKPDPHLKVSNSSPWDDEGVDIRSDGGWVVAPGTVSPWGSWDEVGGCAWGHLREVPEPLWMSLTKQKPAIPKGSSATSSSHWERYNPDEHDRLLHPATREFLDYLTSPDRGPLRVHVTETIVKWSPVGEPYLYLTRPGKNRGVSASLGFSRPDVLYVFSSNWPGVRPNRPYTMWDLHELKQSSPLAIHVSKTDDTDETDCRPRLWRANELKPAAPFRWLVPGLLPAAQVTVLVGDEGIGKSLWWVFHVAALTSGRAEPLLGLPEREPQHVLLVVTEDGWSDCVRPRLEAAGADLDYVHVVAEDDDGSGAPEFPRDLHVVYEAAEKHAVSLVVVDAWLDTVSASKVVKDPQQARQALHPWKDASQRTGASTLLIAHTNRSQSESLRDRVGASGAIRQKARSVLFAAQPPDSPGVLYVGLDKANNSRKAEAMEYRIEAVPVRKPTELDDGTVPVLRLVGATDATMQQHIDEWSMAREPDNSADGRLWDWFCNYIQDHGEPGELGMVVAVAPAQKQARLAGHNPQRLTLAFRGL